MPSHYCRSNTKKEYLEPELTLSRMYNFYVEKCQEESVVPAKSHLYRKIFNTEFNLDFHVPGAIFVWNMTHKKTQTP